MKITRPTIVWLTVFAIAMGYLETAVVVYLRALYYPQGFRFPLCPISADIALTEFLREAATLIMLGGVGWLTGKTAVQRFAFFLYVFAVWDIFYYVFLYALLGWPQSLFTWDVLFLIPVTWVGPVLAPCVVAFTIILFTRALVWLNNNGHATRLPRLTVVLWLAGCLVVTGSFVYGYLAFVWQTHGLAALWMPGTQQPLFAEITQYVPTYYPWWVFMVGETLFLGGTAFFVKYNLPWPATPIRSPGRSWPHPATAETFAEEWESL